MGKLRLYKLSVVFTNREPGGKSDLGGSFEGLGGSVKIKPKCCGMKRVAGFTEQLPHARHFNKALWREEMLPRQPGHGFCPKEAVTHRESGEANCGST